MELPASDDGRNTHIYRIAPPVDTRLTVNVARVSGDAGAHLVIRQDATVLAEVALSAGTADVSLTLPLPAGEYRLALENTGEEWLQIGYVELADYVAPLQALALTDQAQGLLLGWFQNRAYSWETADLSPVSAGFRAEFSGMPVGEYWVEFWDPSVGQIIGEERVVVRAAAEGETRGILTFALLPIERLLAVRVLPVGGLALPTYTPSPTRIVPSMTSTASPTPTATGTPSPTDSGTDIPAPTATDLPTDTAVPSVTARATVTATDPPTDTATATTTATASWTPAAPPTIPPTNTSLATTTPTPTPGPTDTPPAPTVTSTPSPRVPLP